MSTPLVIVETPYAARVALNTEYARACMLDSLRRGEAPFLSHLLYTQVLDDTDKTERMVGILAGLAWGKHAHLTAVYCDLGISPGMVHGIRKATAEGRPIERRRLYPAKEIDV